MNSLESLVRADVRAMAPYHPIEPIEVLAARHGIAPQDVVKLDANESPYGPAPGVPRALAEAPVNIYPDPYQGEVRAALEEHLGVTRERILLGNGSDELLELVTRVLVGPGDEVMDYQPTFGMYRFLGQFAGARVVVVRRRDDYSLDVEAARAAVGPRTKIIFVNTPNNPTGNAASEAEIRALLGLGPLVLLDEAYAEYAGQSFLPLCAEHDNLVVLRTFSKWAALAGLRIGYGVFPTWLMPHLWNVKQPYSVNVAAIAAALVSLRERDWLMDKVRLIVAERARLLERLREETPWLKPLPSQANFILAGVERIEAHDLKERLEHHGVFVRYFATPLLANFIRISVGRPQDTDRLLAALRAEAPEQAKAAEGNPAPG